MRTLAGSDAKVHFTHLSSSSSKVLSAVLNDNDVGPGAARAWASAYQIDVMALMNKNDIPKGRVCLLDPKAETALSPEDGGSFDWFLFGVSTYTLHNFIKIP